MTDLPRLVTVEAARDYWSHETQQEDGVTPADLPSQGVTYIACGPICGAFRQAGYPGIFMADYGVKPEGWGRLEAPARAILAAFWDAFRPQLVIGWTDSRKRAALAFSRRIGFRAVGEMTLADGARIVMQEWRP